MANYYSKTKTNVFYVTDTQEFRKLIDGVTMGSDNETCAEIDDETGACKMYGYGTLWADREDLNNDESGIFDEDKFYNKLSELVRPDSAAVFMETGSEKLRYLVAVAVIVYHGKVDRVNLHHEIERRVREELGDSTWIAEI